jgi:hypothetical protein
MSFTFGMRSYVTVARVDSEGIAHYEPVATAALLKGDLVHRSKRLFLRLTNAWRNVGPLMTDLEALSGFGFAVKGLTLTSDDINQVLSQFEQADLVGIKVINVVAGPDLVGRMEFASRQGFDRTRIKVLKGLPHQIEHSSYVLLYRGLRGTVAFSASGSVKIAGPLGPRILSVIERQLITA